MKKKIIAIVVMLGVLGTIITGNINAANSNIFTADITVGGKNVSAKFFITDTVTKKVSLEIVSDYSTIAGKLVIPNTVKDGDVEYQVTKIGDFAFYNCDGLTSTGLESNTSVVMVGDCAFAGCTGLTSTGLESNTSVVMLGGKTFAECTGLKSTGLEDNETLTELHGTFSGCTGLTSTGLENNKTLTTLSGGVFSGCTGLTSTGLENNKTLTYIASAFDNCTGLTSTGLESNTILKTNVDWAFTGCTGLTSTGLENNKTLTTLGVRTFANCIGLESTGLENNTSIIAIGTDTFYNCGGIKSTGLENNKMLTTLGNRVFSGCTGLESTGLENNTSITILGEQAFKNCTKLTSVIIPKQITDIGKEAFVGCSQLEKVIFSDSIPVLGEGIFPSSTHIYYPDGVNANALTSYSYIFPYIVETKIIDTYDKYHEDDTYSGEELNVSDQYISDGEIFHEVNKSKDEIQKNLLLPNNYALKAGENVIHAKYYNKDIDFTVHASEHLWEWIIDVFPTITSTGLKHQKCSICLKELEGEVIDRLYSYKVLESIDNYTKGSKKDITYKIDGDYSLFEGIKVDGNVISKENYTSSQGSTVITLKSIYLETLSEGNHEITVMFDGNEVKILLAVQPNPNQTSNKTDDETSDEKPNEGTPDTGDKTSETKPNTPTVIVPNTPVLNNPETTTNQTNDSTTSNENIVSTSDKTSMLAYMGIFVLSGIVGCYTLKKRKENL